MKMDTISIRKNNFFRFFTCRSSSSRLVLSLVDPDHAFRPEGGLTDLHCGVILFFLVVVVDARTNHRP